MKSIKALVLAFALLNIAFAAENVSGNQLFTLQEKNKLVSPPTLAMKISWLSLTELLPLKLINSSSTIKKDS